MAAGAPLGQSELFQPYWKLILTGGARLSQIYGPASGLGETIWFHARGLRMLVRFVACGGVGEC